MELIDTHSHIYYDKYNDDIDILHCDLYRLNSYDEVLELGILDNLDKKIWGYDTFEQGFLKDSLSEFDIDFKNKKVTLENDNTRYFTVSEVISNINQQDAFDPNKYFLINYIYLYNSSCMTSSLSNQPFPLKSNS